MKYYWRKISRNFGIVTKSKNEVRPEKLEFDEVYKRHFTKFVQGDFSGLSEGFLRERFRNASDRVGH